MSCLCSVILLFFVTNIGHLKTVYDVLPKHQYCFYQVHVMNLYPRHICENCMINVVVDAAKIGNNFLMGCTMTHACSQDTLQRLVSFYKSVLWIEHLLFQLLIKQAHPPLKRRNMDYKEGGKVPIGSIIILCFIPPSL